MEPKLRTAAFVITEVEVESFLSVMPRDLTEGYLWRAVQQAAETGIAFFYTDELSLAAQMARRSARGGLERLVTRLEDRGQFAPVQIGRGGWHVIRDVA